METTKKRPLGYADLSIVQLKSFADRGDARAKEELGKRLSAPVAPPTAPPKATPINTTGARRSAGRMQPMPATAATATGKASGVDGQERVAAPMSAMAHGMPRTAGLADRPAGNAAREQVVSDAAAALRQAEALLAAAVPGMAHVPTRQAPARHQLLINDAPGSNSGGTMSPELIAKLEEIARNTPDDDEPTPPAILGGSMMALGLVVMLFGFGVTRGATGTWYFAACGLAMAASGLLYFKGMKLALPVYALTCAMAVLWAVYESPTWLEAVLRAVVPLMIAGYAFLPRVRERLG